MTVTIILVTSILLQLTATYLALRLIGITKKWPAWTLIAAAIAFMAIRRGITLYHLSYQHAPTRLDLATGLVGLAISLLLVLALAGVGPLFLAICDSEAKLRKANAYLENLLENSADAIGIVDAPGKITKWNKAAEDFYGYSSAEIQGKSFYEFYADSKELNIMMKKLRQDGFVRSYEIDMKKKDGSTAPFSLSIKLMKDDQGGNLGSLCMARDRSEIRKSLSDLQLMNERLQSLVQEKEQCNHEINIINLMSEQLQTSLSCTEAYPLIVQHSQDLFPARSGALFMLDPVNKLLEGVATWGIPLAGDLVFPANDCLALQLGRLQWAGDHCLGIPCRLLASPNTKKGLCIPLLAHNESLGLLHIQDLSGLSQERTEPVQRLAVTVADQLSLALANIKLRETLQYQVIHDSLTGLFNRRYLEETLVREIQRVKRKGAPLGVVMLDLDHFKRFNDTYGHEAGDNLLRTLGHFLQTQVRQEDVACRYGGGGIYSHYAGGLSECNSSAG